jgi:hypothetical protein
MGWRMGRRGIEIGGSLLGEGGGDKKLGEEMLDVQL